MTSVCEDLCVSVFWCICVRGEASLHLIPSVPGSVRACMQNIRVLEFVEESWVIASGALFHCSVRHQLWLKGLQEFSSSNMHMHMHTRM